MSGYVSPQVTITRIKAGAQPIDGADFKELSSAMPRAIGATAIGGAAIIGAAGDLGTAAGRISTITSPEHW